jgi:hypothetical protein
MQMRRHTGDTARKNLAAFGDKFFQHIRVLIIDRFDRDVDSPSRHGAIRPAKGGTTLGSFGLHGWLLRFPMESMPFQEWIVFLFLEAIGRARAFLVSRGHVTRRRLMECFRLGAFQNNNFLRHFLLLCLGRRNGFFFLPLAAFLLGESKERRNRLPDA